MNWTDLLPQLPLTNPTLIFFVVLSIILLAPILLQRIRVPHIIGLILAGLIVGPNGIGILKRDTSFMLFGQVGLLYLMFLAGLEMDMNEFRRNKTRGLVFGLYTFFIPMLMGSVAGHYLLHLNWIQSVLLASMFASHTLVAYPIISRYGLSKKRTVTITIAGSIITVLLALLILAIITAMYRGELNTAFWIRFIVSNAVYAAFIFGVLPRVSRWFLRKYGDNVTQYIFVLGVVFAASFAAELAGLESIIGAFLAGVILNRYIPSISPLMNRIEFVGNALFIPYFLIGVGMLVDLRVIFIGTETVWVAFVMSVIATLSKWTAAWVTQKSFSMSILERRLIFGLSNGQAAATLAAVLIGYNIITGTNPDGTVIRLLDESILNGTIIMILVTCTISSVWTEKAAEKMAIQPVINKNMLSSKELDERILIPVANPATISNLVALALMIKNKKRKLPLYALSIETERDENTKDGVSKSNVLHDVAKLTAAADTPTKLISRFDVNIASGIIHTIKENQITDIVVGFHHKANIADTFFGPTTRNILHRTNRMMLILKTVTPIHTVNKIIIAIPEKAEYETGFERWVDRIANMAMQIGCRVIFYCTQHTEQVLKKLVEFKKYQLRLFYQSLESWKELPSLKKEVHEHDLFTIICARPTSISYNSDFDKLPLILSEEFDHTNLLVIYPEQFNKASEETAFYYDPQAQDVEKKFRAFDHLEKWNKRFFHSDK